MKLKRLAAVIGLGLLGASATAQAYTYSLWRFEDDSIDFILREDGAGGFDIITSGAPQEGDIFVGIFEFRGATAYPNGGGPGSTLIPPGKEMTGVSVFQLVTPNPTTALRWDFLPYTGGMNSILTWAGAPSLPSVYGGDAGGGAMAAVWINNAPSGTAGSNPSTNDRNLILSSTDPNYGLTTNCTSLQDCLREASLGELFQVDGMWGVDRGDRYDPDNYWISIGGFGITYDDVKDGEENEPFAIFKTGLSNLYNDDEPVLFMNGNVCSSVSPYSADGCVQVSENGTILGGTGLTNGAIARDHIDARKYVPEPATLGLMGLGLLGLGLLRRRQG